MSQNLSALESAVLDRLALKYPILQRHLHCAKVSRREFTGVGLYTYITYECPDLNNLELFNPADAYVSINEIINVPGLKFGVNHVVSMSEGKIAMIEFVTPDDEWDGLAPDFSFTPYSAE